VKMTLAEALAIPVGMDYEEYGKLLRKRKRLAGRIRNLNNAIQDAEDALDVLDDERGSERWQKWVLRKAQFEQDLEAAEAAWEAL